MCMSPYQIRQMQLKDQEALLKERLKETLQRDRSHSKILSENEK